MPHVVLYPHHCVPEATLGPSESASGVALYPRASTTVHAYMYAACQHRTPHTHGRETRAHGECEGTAPPKGRESGPDHELVSTGGPHSQGEGA